MDSWKSPFSVKVINNFLNNHYNDYFSKLINNRTFIPATQGVNNKQIVQEHHKIRLDYTLNLDECSFIDKLIINSNCNCNLRERWRLLFYDGDAEKKAFRDAHTDWTNNACHRRMSIIIGLSNPSDYEGGELVFPDDNLKYKINKGSAIIFDSKLLHEVLPVTKGKRYVIQAFLFDETGWNLKKVQNGYKNFILRLENDLDQKKGNFVDKTWEMLENKNMVHSRIDSYTSNYLGDCKNYYEVETLLNKNSNVDYFTWHKPSIRNKKWKNRLYGWTTEYCKNKNRDDPKSWPSETDVISGYKINNFNKISPNDNNTLNINNSLTIIPCDGGPGNQVMGIKEGLILSKYLKRNFIFPPIIQHYTLNRAYRGGTENIKFWNFNQIYNYNNEDNELFKKIHEFNNIENNIYCTKSSIINEQSRCEKLLNIKGKKLKIKNHFEDKDSILMTFSNLTDPVIMISHLYNNIHISHSGWNGSDTDPVNLNFIQDYKDICKNFDYSSNIKNIGDNYILNNFGKSKFIALHMRYSDIGEKSLKDINYSFNEDHIYNFIKDLSEKNNINMTNIFIATNKQNIINKTLLKQCKKLPYNIANNELESFIEQYICSKSEKFVYLGGALAKPDHSHIRSTWTSFVIDYRLCKLNKKIEDNFYLMNCFNNSKQNFGYNH
ncbi:2OG-Fe(II) oxygenase [bacterium]|nr:2OG-Fe(II) oxygenase [bacterium]